MAMCQLRMIEFGSNDFQRLNRPTLVLAELTTCLAKTGGIGDRVIYRRATNC